MRPTAVRSIEKYLATYAEPEAQALPAVPPDPWHACVVVPLCEEEDLVGGLLDSLAKAAGALRAKALAILVVNGREDHGEPAHATNARLLLSLPRAGRFASYDRALDLYVVDRASAGRRFPAGQGVGLARKLGSDLAAALYARGALASDLVHTTDADARVGDGYFDSGGALRTHGLGDRIVALNHPFLHEVGGGTSPPLQLYEISLRYYVLGLEHSGSPYAFHTIGSTLAYRVGAYTCVRGFPRRQAAEDFYLLGKLAKIGKIGTSRVASGEVRLVPRPSHRVPFGTGRAMARISLLLEQGHAFLLYDPRVFDHLRDWLAAAERFTLHRNLPRLLGELAPVAGEALQEMGMADAFRRALDSRPEAASLGRHLHTWFDGLRTLKFIHALRSRGLKSRPWQEALGRAPFLPQPMPRSALEALTQLRETEKSLGR